MWTYTLGPLAALLPKRWRKALPFAHRVNWAHAAVLSGLAEFLVGLGATLQWYSISMTTWVQRGLDVAMNSNAGITDQAVGAMAWFMWINHPLTWVLGYFSLEGAIRLCAAGVADSMLGTLPLFVIDKAARFVFGGSQAPAEVSGMASSFIGAVSDKVLESSVPASADEVSFNHDASGDELMEIRASRKKPDWDPPRVVRCGETYYRLEACSKGPGARPFRYTLRRLPAGVPGRTVLLYDPAEAAVAGKR